MHRPVVGQSVSVDWKPRSTGFAGRCRSMRRSKTTRPFASGGRLMFLVEPADVDDVARLVRQTKAQKLPLFVVGGHESPHSRQRD